MYRIILEWSEGDRLRTRTISTDDPTLFPNVIRLGRGDQTQCDVILTNTDPQIERTVSRLHAEIIFDPQKKAFFLRNLTGDRPAPNPIIVDNQTIIKEVVKLDSGTTIKLGKILLTVKTLEIISTSSQYIVKCSGPKQHLLTKEYEGLNCPYCGYLVFTGTILKT
ncbi:FHA domain-containing protein [Gloeocapsa sp. PCC 73106]|uniref:FHA domain-containing protein n=1 Tax=Gloeocapsa sp. PCC 73106 TaxID=102232 RepID=UPI0002AD1288|nr:FHA domain-containing protein [Gloeocapsa sp. PCC 73106]ELR99597.1 FHA domain-containing protein [Gloeocapsa sp. PCC 73106]